MSCDIVDMSAVYAQIYKHIKYNVAYDMSVDDVAGGVQCLKLSKLNDGELHGASIILNSKLM